MMRRRRLILRASSDSQPNRHIVNYLEQVIKAGAKDHFDYITLHPYEVLDGIADNKGTEPIFMNIVPVVRKMLAAQNPAKVNVPIIFTELGCDAKQKGDDTQAHALDESLHHGHRARRAVHSVVRGHGMATAARWG